MTERGPALPPEVPLPMRRQILHDVRHAPRLRQPSRRRAVCTAAARIALVAAIAGLAGYGISEMYGVMSAGGVTLLQWAFLVAFALSFLWISNSACQAAIGFLRLLWQDLSARPADGDGPADIRTAILMPVYNEDPDRAAAGIRAMAEELAMLAPDRFCFFLLSDSNMPDRWVREERAFSALAAAVPAACPVYYRHRRDNAERKAGNIADWVTRWGGAYEAMVVLDADSLIGPATLVELARRLADSPAVGLIQTLPVIADGRSLFARLQQFANRCYGPVHGNGLAAWYGAGGNFWGHNAIIRTRAFAASARLPILPGEPPFGGPVMSHDFVEAAMLRRGGWDVRFDTDLGDSFEEAPPSLVDVMIRDRRWCQGNLQHVSFLVARGIPVTSRVHLLTGILAYLSAPLWLLLILIGLALSVQVALSGPEYFSGPSLFPVWPVFDAERAIRLFLVSIGVVLTPKVLGWAAAMINPRRCIAFGGPLRLTLGLLTETAFSALYAPILMLSQSHIVWQILLGGDSGWKPQRRGDSGIAFRTALRTHAWHALIGVALGGAILGISEGLFLWTLPLTGALALSPVLSWLSGSRAAGRAFYRLGLLRTPEERRRSRARILQRRDELLPAEPAAAGSALAILAADSALNAWHRDQLRDRPADMAFDPRLVIARAKAAREPDIARLAAWLSPAEQIAFLHDPGLVERLLTGTGPMRRTA